MNLVNYSIRKPVTILVGVILVVMFGLISLGRLPYQLSPTVVEPEISVSTIWRGATPYEIERDIIEEQEKVLKGIPGLVELESESFNNQGTVTLRFEIGTDVDDALLRVSNKLNEVESYPENVEQPVISATGAATSPVIWLIMKANEGNPRTIDTYRTFFENEVRQHLERVSGVADLFVGGGTESEMHVVVRPESLAAYGLTVNDVMGALRSENANVSAGVLGVGRREFRIRTTAEYRSPEDIENVVLRSTGQERVFMRDVAQVRPGYEKKTTAMLHNGELGMAVGVLPEPGTNILAMTGRVFDTVQWLNEEKMAPENIRLEWVYDQRPYINEAIGLIKRNILIGGILATAVLLIFLRSIRSTVVVMTAIPISIIGTFIFLQLMGRNLNVVSLAGIAFAVGMLVDSAIVVIENIDRHRKMGKSPFDSAYDGTVEVWGAILASTLTTVAVFLPVVFLEQEAGQLFRDIAIAVVAAITLSLFVSISVIPMFSRQVFALTKGKKLRLRENVLTRLGHGIAGGIVGLVTLAISNWATRLVTVGTLTVTAIGIAFFLFPKMEYLPLGNRNLVINILVPPPGLSYAERESIGKSFMKGSEPYLGKDHEGVAGIENMFYVGSEQVMLSGATSIHRDRARELLPLFSRLIFSTPGMFGVSQQAGIFQTRLGRGRTVEVDISGNDLNQVVGAAGMMFGRLNQVLPGAQIRPVPSIEVLFPEVRFLPHRDRLRANGMSAQDLGVALDVLMDGRDVGDFKREGKKKIDLVLMSSEEQIGTPEELYNALVATPRGKVVPVSSLAELQRTTGVTQIRHLERNRTVTLQVTPPLEIPLQAATETIESDVIAPMKEDGALGGLSVRISGAADKLTVTRRALQWNFVLAAAIAYLLMAALFGNFIYPLVIMFSVPLAAAGGILGLNIINIFVTQPLDIVTMLGFVILIGVVVNNAILIVYQALNNIRLHGMDYKEAVVGSVRVRLRPIYMSASTSIFGMLPLVIFPGAGSELYRGLGSVILGGIAVSTIFTVFVIPSLLMFVIRMEKPAGGAAGAGGAEAEKSETQEGREEKA
ncbi:MAG: efflux RND transporter permease subunit [Nitrospirota bacterium]|jgi:HAE1 family hydrophobic/amphiphilic exporter-1